MGDLAVCEPGELAMLGAAGHDAWSSSVIDLVTAPQDEAPALRPRPDKRTPYLWTTEWTGLPQRVVTCLGRQSALALLDWTGDEGSSVRRRLQEEYVEWRTLRDDDGRLRRIEFTTELPEHWALAAAHEPGRLLATVAALAGGASVDPSDVFGDCDPFAASATPEERAAGFTGSMLLGGSPYNGSRAICCMIQSTNTLTGLVSLLRGALRTWTVVEEGGGTRRCFAAEDVLPLMPGLAVPGRASDPLLAERVARLAWEGRAVALDEPLGVYIQSAELGRLRTPDGGAVPPEWFVLSRGLPGSATPDGLPRWQRAVFEVPADEGYDLADLVDVATEAPLSFGGQVAELLQIVVHLRVSDRDVMPRVPRPTTLSEPSADADGCADVMACLAESLR
jgi:hypothetical protein